MTAELDKFLSDIRYCLSCAGWSEARISELMKRWTDLIIQGHQDGCKPSDTAAALLAVLDHNQTKH